MIGDFYANVTLSSDREPSTKVSFDRDAFWELTIPRVEDGDSYHQKIVSERQPAKKRPPPRKREWHQRHREQPVETFCENEAHHRGTSADCKMSLMTESGVAPSSSASARSVKRWRRTGRATSRTSSGVEKSRPRIADNAFEHSNRATAARGLAP